MTWTEEQISNRSSSIYRRRPPRNHLYVPSAGYELCICQESQRFHRQPTIRLIDRLHIIVESDEMCGIRLDATRRPYFVHSPPDFSGAHISKPNNPTAGIFIFFSDYLEFVS